MQVTVLDMDQLEPQEEDVVVMATDGLWDVLSNEQVAWLVRSFLLGNREDPHRYCSCWDLPGPGLVPAAALRSTEKTTQQRSPAKNSWPGLELPQVSWG